MTLFQARLTMRHGLVAVFLALVATGGWMFYRGVSESLEAERTLHATLFSVRLVEQFVSEHGRWPRSWNELEMLSTRETLFGAPWPAVSASIRRRVAVDFAVNPEKLARQDQDPMAFTAIRPIGPGYGYRDSPYLASLQRAIRKSCDDHSKR